MRQELKALWQITGAFTKVIAALWLAQQYIWLMWAVWG